MTELSLDHDLGDDAHGTGYDVLTWIEEAVAIRGFHPPRISVHSAESCRGGAHASSHRCQSNGSR